MNNAFVLLMMNYEQRRIQRLRRLLYKRIEGSPLRIGNPSVKSSRIITSVQPERFKNVSSVGPQDVRPSEQSCISTTLEIPALIMRDRVTGIRTVNIVKCNLSRHAFQTWDSKYRFLTVFQGVYLCSPSLSHNMSMCTNTFARYFCHAGM